MEQVILSIIWFGQSCFLLQAGDTRILMDPIPPSMGYPVEATAAGVVTISHEHFDHNYVELAKGNPAILRGLSEKGKDWKPIDFSNKDVKITAFPTCHDNEKGAKRGKNAMFLIETQGLRVLHTGDLGHTLDKETVTKIGKVDILMICVGGYYTIDATAAKEVTNELHPRVVIPMHYKTESTPKIPISGLDEFLSGWKNVRRSKEERVGFTTGLAGYPKGETTVLVLPHAQPAAKPIKWGEEGPKSQPPRPYCLLKAWVDYSEGVNLHLEYERKNPVDNSRVRLKICELGLTIYFVRGIHEVQDFPRIKSSEAVLSEVRKVGDVYWQYLGTEIQDPKDKSVEGAYALIFVDDKGAGFHPDAGQVSVPLVGSKAIPFHGEGMAVLYLGDYYLVKGAKGGEFRQLSNAMAVPIRFPAKEESPTKEWSTFPSQVIPAGGWSQ